MLFIGFILAFLSIRLSVRMIRAGVSWWPGNINRGGVHIHHVVFGIALMTVCGVASFAPFSSTLTWRSAFAAGFGVGTALVLDEFALVLHLQDVYWTEQGRRSVDAVFLGVALMGMLVLGAAPLGIDDIAPGERASRWDITATVLLNALLVIITLAKGKVWTGLIGVLAPGSRSSAPSGWPGRPHRGRGASTGPGPGSCGGRCAGNGAGTAASPGLAAGSRTAWPGSRTSPALR